MLRAINLNRNTFILILSVSLAIFFFYLDIYIFLVFEVLDQYISLTISIGILSLTATIIFLVITLLLTHQLYQYRRLEQVGLFSSVNITSLIASDNNNNYSDEWYEEINTEHI